MTLLSVPNPYERRCYLCQFHNTFGICAFLSLRLSCHWSNVFISNCKMDLCQMYLLLFVANPYERRNTNGICASLSLRLSSHWRRSWGRARARVMNGSNFWRKGFLYYNKVQKLVERQIWIFNNKHITVTWLILWQISKVYLVDNILSLVDGKMYADTRAVTRLSKIKNISDIRAGSCYIIVLF